MLPPRTTTITNMPRYYGMNVKRQAPAAYYLGKEPQLHYAGHWVRPTAGQEGVIRGREETQKSILMWNSTPVSLTMPPAIRHTK
jgi:hypothetical protein